MTKGITLDLATAAAVGSILVHVEEANSARGHPFDWNAVDTLMAQANVKAFLGDLRGLALLPVKR